MTSTGTTGRVLGLSGGATGGSVEIVVAAALDAARGAGAEVELVRLNDLMIATDGASDVDDTGWLWERLVECDGLVVGTSVMTRTMSARLKLVVDRLLGPNADAAIIEHLVALRHAGEEPVVPFRVDERVLKPRVAGFLAVGGSLTPQWKSLVLPLMHTMTLSMHIAVVDQVVFGGAGTPRSILLDDAALHRAATLGANVASQLGRTFDEARYLGEPGLCPLCHLNVVVLDRSDVTCATCGASGELRPDLTVGWTDLTSSVLSMAEKRAHAREIQETAARHLQLRSELDQRAADRHEFAPIARP